MGRAVGDTLVSLMVAGNAAQVPHSLFDSVRTLTAHIALVLATDSHSMAYQSVFAAGLFLFLLTASVPGVLENAFFYSPSIISSMWAKMMRVTPSLPQIVKRK